MLEASLPMVGLDAGNAVCKVVLGAAKRDWLQVPTVILAVPSDEPVVRNDLTVASLLDSLDVSVDSPALPAPGRWKVGEAVTLDRRRGDRGLTPQKGDPKVNSLPVKVTALATIAAAAIKRHPAAEMRRTSEMAVTVDRLVVGLPYGQVDQDRQVFADMLRGRHTLAFHGLPGIGHLQVRLEIASVTVLPEGYGAAVSMVYEVDGSGALAPVRERAEWLQEPLAVVDVGAGTSDVVALSLVKGRWSLDASRCETLPFGVADALESAVAKLQADGWSRFTNVAVVTDELSAGHTTLTDRRDGKKTTNLTDYVFNGDLKALGERIATLIASKWDRELSRILLCGGGAKLLLDSGFLQVPYARQPELVKHPQWANALGHYYVALRTTTKRG